MLERAFTAGRTPAHPSAALRRPTGVLLSLLALGCATAGGAGESPREAREAEVHQGTFELGGEARAYVLYRAATAPPSGAPLLVMLHGCTQSAADVAAGTRLNAVAEERGLLVLYPEQSAVHPQRCWRWYDAAHQQREGGEPQLIAAMTRQLAQQHGADPSRIYIAGISAGGIMAVTVALGYPELFVAVASHSGSVYGVAKDLPGALALMRGERPDARAAVAAAEQLLGTHQRLPPLMIVHGDSDTVVRPANAEYLAEQWSGLAQLMELPLTRERAEPVEEGGRAVRRETWRSRGEVVVELLMIDGLAHAWSGGSSEGTYTDPRGPDATRAVVDFLLGHRRQP